MKTIIKSKNQANPIIILILIQTKIILLILKSTES